MPWFTTMKRSPFAACRRRDSTSGQRSSPLMRGRGAVGDRIAEGHDRLGCRRPDMSTSSRKYQEVVENGNAPSASARSFRAAAGRRQVGGGERLGVPGHRPAFARDMEADGELAAGEQRVGGDFTKGSATASLSTLSPGATVTPSAAESERPVGAGEDGAAAFLQAHETSSKVTGSCRRRWRGGCGSACPRRRAARSGGRSGRWRPARATGRRTSSRAARSDCRSGRDRARSRSSSPPTFQHGQSWSRRTKSRAARQGVSSAFPLIVYLLLASLFASFGP